MHTVHMLVYLACYCVVPLGLAAACLLCVEFDLICSSFDMATYAVGGPAAVPQASEAACLLTDSR